MDFKNLYYGQWLSFGVYKVGLKHEIVIQIKISITYIKAVPFCFIQYSRFLSNIETIIFAHLLY